MLRPNLTVIEVGRTARSGITRVSLGLRLSIEYFFRLRISNLKGHSAAAR